ncbi:MAG TPA: trypsin-like serine protease [Stenomitos sp.]
MSKQSVRFFALSAGLLVTVAPFLTHIPSFAGQGSLSYPDKTLAKSDGRAKLDPKLLDVPPAPQPKLSKSNVRSGIQREIGFNLKTKTVKTVSLPKGRAALGQTFAPGNSGFNAADQKEPKAKPGSRSVIGTDDRILITSTTSTPWRMMTKLYMTFPNGKVYSCSGGLIAAKYVLTAGHCIHSSADGGWATKVEVIPGLSGSYKPYGSAFATYLRTYTGWTSSQNPNYDFALVTLDRTIGNTTGWFGYGYFPTINGVTGNLGGYPGDKGGLNLYYHYGPISSSTSQRLSYQIDTAPGQSGSSVYRFYTPSGGVSGRYVFGVHTNGAGSGSYNSGTRIDSAKYSNLQSWIGSGF